MKVLSHLSGIFGGNKKEKNLLYVVNFTNKLWAAFAPIIFQRKNYKAKL